MIWNWRNACAGMRARLPLLAGGELVGAERRRAERHLIGCPACRQRLASLREVLAVLHAAGAQARADRPSARESLWPALARQIRESRRPAARSGLGGANWPLEWDLDASQIGPRLAWSSLGLACGLGLALGALLLRGGLDPDNPTPATPTATAPTPSPTAAISTPTPPATAPPAIVSEPAPTPPRPALEPDPALTATPIELVTQHETDLVKDLDLDTLDLDLDPDDPASPKSNATGVAENTTETY